ncbi:hypothetical protein AA23498_2678 [Acetobacter nitrogenifigens DSM 23921 = NBRC 105050]|uniref:Uncharacterized protein n=1 Tax=Acetobacter nitrogenifigens DSM 23921 = NBRC 105050 TaxID=1120919 RepID=A0A511XEN5_9PROT|nr:hypothetical protein [Acetobacter nitrogenifigens]GBQ96589.1 hypothetical protein AA23498_2678 [Acetobacter nitrogenifigens DSM 23921 = NBRC 105050]GEN61413.1 hypothetical protein ANI02nite_32970 [Acetobacter nitrogenifigens DSM 23921 = NBRC 105050]
MKEIAIPAYVIAEAIAFAFAFAIARAPNEDVGDIVIGPTAQRDAQFPPAFGFN